MYCKVHSTLAKAGYACMYVVVLLLRSNSNKQARPSWNLHQFFNVRLWLRASSGGSRPSRAFSLVSPQTMASNATNGNTHQVPVGLDDYVGLRTQLAISQHAAQTASQTAQAQHPQPPPHAVAYPPPPRPPPPPYSGPYVNWNPHPYTQPRPPMGQAPPQFAVSDCFNCSRRAWWKGMPPVSKWNCTCGDCFQGRLRPPYIAIRILVSDTTST